MKFDIARAWKDETYRQSLSQEQLSTLPANPVGELSDTDLANISGSGISGPDGANSFGGSNSFGGFTGFTGFTGFANIHNESATVVACEINVFSIGQIAALPILSAVAQSCIKG